jgi:DNA modification methylase
MAKLEVVYRDPASLKPDPRNARTHSKAQIGEISASIKSTLFANPILIDEGLRIIAGHGRLQAAKSMGLTEVPTIELAGLTSGQKRLLNIADNKIALNASWDFELLKETFEELRIEDLDPLTTGFSAGELDLILKDQADPADDTIPEVRVDPVSRLGDIWIMGEHRTACGDVRSEQLLERLVQGALVDAAYLDPPYNQPARNIGNRGRTKHSDLLGAAGELSHEAFTQFLVDTLGACARVSRDGAVHFVCMDHQHIDNLLSAGGGVYGKRLNLVVWNKSNAGMGSLYRSKHELIGVFRVGSGAHRNNVELGRHGRNRTNVWDYASVNSFRGSRSEDLKLHPTVKPTAMVADAVKDVTSRGEIVLDTFLGSGTTLIAAERTGRRCFGMDLEPKYVDVAIDRWMALTNREAVLESTGELFAEVQARRANER